MPPCLRVLVVGADPVLQETCKTCLVDLGHEYCCVPTGAALVEQCRQALPGLVIVEVQLPDLDGFVAAENVSNLQPLPFLFVFDNLDDAALVRLAKNPCILACLSKPVKPPDLRAAIVVATRCFAQYQTLKQQVAQMRQLLEDRTVIERAKGVLMRRLGMDEAHAYHRLRKLSTSQNTKLLDLAKEVLAAEKILHLLE